MAAIDEGRRPSGAEAPPGLRDGPLRVSQTAGALPVLRASGAVDLNGHDDWGRALRTAPLHDGELHLDLTDLAFIDMRGITVLVDVAQRLPEGARIVVHRPPPCFGRMMEVLWPGGVEAITVKGDAP
ncbi:STAS domain-containing protein [Glycomyces harbinensis]|uniref:STAS domain-containing protein n=1 Tax=Glycomyces harbinensis TaxID=58114 RepID=A0A1G6QP94_9ACTN|nr:STAS domain-containing protein [Glycomyces harbinensis]SDC94200.1 STAS domain-containing protein [Glycomyces harbinensis]